jgi:DegV family protein with EDD domain
MVRIVADSTSNLPRELTDRYGIEVVPLRVIFPGGTTYRDGIEITTGEFYRMMAASPMLPTTSQPPAAEFEDVFARLTASGDEVLAIVISGYLSGTLASAVAAQRSLAPAKITVFDSLAAAAPVAFMVQRAAERAATGASVQEITADLEILRARMQMLFVVDTLEYLQKGGRIGGAAALAGSLLRIKPILIIKEGRVDAWGKVRGKRKALQLAIEATAQHVGTGPSVRAAVMHAACEQEAREFGEQVVSALGCPAPPLSELSPVLGVHVGPGTLAVAAYNEQWL